MQPSIWKEDNEEHLEALTKFRTGKLVNSKNEEERKEENKICCFLYGEVFLVKVFNLVNVARCALHSYPLYS